MKQLVIGVTDCSKFDNYNNWILNYDKAVQTIKISFKDNSIDELKKCDGVLLTGGEDVHPRFYNMPEYYDYCYADDVSEERDELEWKVLEYTQKHKLPVLGICRGLQIANVFFGGTLVPDIPTWGKYNHSKLPDDTDRYHEVQVDPNSVLFDLIQEQSGIINSNHHQSADKIGKGLIVAALSADGVVEALERSKPNEGPYLSLVQWHPERMKDQESPFVKKIREAFIQACLASPQPLS